MIFSSKTTSIGAARFAVLLAFGLLVLAPSPAAAQGYCAQHVETIFPSSSWDNCTSEPFRDRAFAVKTFVWKGHDYLMLNRGNELSIYNVDDPTLPSGIDTSDFDFGTRGDSDYDLINFDICDDCRYGVFSHKLKRTVVFDLGTGAAPKFGGWATYDANESIAGGFVFLKGGQQYLIAADLPESCNKSGLYMVSGPNQLDFLECLEVGGSAVTIKGLNTITDDFGVLFLYAGARSGPVHVFRAAGIGADLTLVYETSPAGMYGRSSELSIDTNNKRAASADFFGEVVNIWDLSAPDSPVHEFSVPLQTGNVSLRSPSAGAPSTLSTTMVGAPNSTRTFVVENTGYGEVVDETYWTDESLPHNSMVSCDFSTGGALSRDGSVLFLSRYAINQVFDLTDCLTPTPPNADMAITPTELFPGDTVTVRDISTGNTDRWALWITEGSSPSGTLVAGSSTLSSVNPQTIAYTIPVNLADGQGYWTHLELESDDFSPPDDFDSLSLPITINRRPAATISVDPETVIVTDRVDLSAAVNGGSPTSYEWEVWPPGASTPDTYSEQQVSNLLLDVSGDWRFDVVANFQHDDPDGAGSYQATDSYDLAVSSVAADFFWTPASPLHTYEITLDGSTSKPSSGLTYEWQVVEQGGPGGYTGCPATVRCTIPPDTLDPDTVYIVTLTASNGPDTSVKTEFMTVGDGNVAPTISWSPNNPEIGEDLVFSINGVPADIDSASWNLGGSGCDGADSTPVCTPSLWNECKALSYVYSSSGTKTVTLSVVVGENTFTAPPVQVSVQASGSCSPPPPPPGECEYTLGQTSMVFGPNGTTLSSPATFSVQTTSNCRWVANTITPWITILSPGGQATGTGTVTFQVGANTGTERVGSIIAGGKVFIVTQEAPWRAANFTMSNPSPEIGEIVTFSVDPALEVESWDFGENDCRGNSRYISCSGRPTGFCNTMQWTFPTEGGKPITMVLADTRTQTKIPTVRPVGECCFADGRPDASFEMSADEAYTGERVYFTDTSLKVAVNTKATGMSWSPSNPEIGSNTTFTLDGVVGTIEQATWDFGDVGCNGADRIAVCTPSLWNKCTSYTFAYASSGQKTVSVTLELEGGGTASAGPVTVDVANSGACDGGGGGCSYSLSQYSVTFPPEGGADSFDVSTTAECAWDATNASTWVTISSGGGSGPGTVTYSVAPNESPSSRQTLIWVENRSFRLTQEPEKGDTAPTAWQWTVTRVEDENGNPVNEDIGAGTEPNFSHVFKEPGLHRVSLTTTNCFGSDSTLDYIMVEEAPVEDFVVGAAVSLAGANDTHWESDFRFHNPCGEDLDVRIEYQPENTNNAGAELEFRVFQLFLGETRVFDHITDAIPGLGGDEISGSVRIESTSDSGCKVLSVSRTFNDTPDGSLGLFVPALPIKRVGLEFLDLNGLIHNQDYRTNLRLVNYSDEEVWVPLTAYDKGGNQVGERRSTKVRAQSTKQINEIAEWLGVTENLAPFAVRAEIEGLDVQAFGTVVDNLTGDSVLYLSSFYDENKVWLVGVASLSGANDSQWRTDLWLYNPTGDWLPGEIEFVVGDNPSDAYGFAWPNLGTHRTKQYLDIVSNQLGLEETRGYIVLTGADGGPAPQVAARTYNLDPTGGTYGLNLRAFGSKDLLQPGETGYIAGISNSSDQGVGFRTNVGVLNTDRNGWTTVQVTMYNLDGSQAAEPNEITIAPGKLRQFDIFKKLGLNDTDMTGSLVVEAVSGGAVAVYATEIDNRTQDSIFIPAQRIFVGLAQ